MNDSIDVEPTTDNVNKILREINYKQKDCDSNLDLLFTLDSTDEFNILSTKTNRMPGINIEHYHIFNGKIIVAIKIQPPASEGIA